MSKKRKIRVLHVLTGLRPDVPRLMFGAMDTFLFPSLWEGLGIVLLEAQSAGLPNFYSDVVPPEANVVPKLVHKLRLAQSAAAWTRCILERRSTEVT